MPATSTVWSRSSSRPSDSAETSQDFRPLDTPRGGHATASVPSHETRTAPRRTQARGCKRRPRPDQEEGAAWTPRALTRIATPGHAPVSIRGNRKENTSESPSRRIKEASARHLQFPARTPSVCPQPGRGPSGPPPVRVARSPTWSPPNVAFLSPCPPIARRTRVLRCIGFCSNWSHGRVLRSPASRRGSAHGHVHQYEHEIELLPLGLRRRFHQHRQ